jgi:hypothetical protein
VASCALAPTGTSSIAAAIAKSVLLDILVPPVWSCHGRALATFDEESGHTAMTGVVRNHYGFVMIGAARAGGQDSGHVGRQG